MKCYCFTIKFPTPLLNYQEEVLISFFQRAIEEGIEKSKELANMAKSMPGVGNKVEILDTMKDFMEMQKKFFRLEKIEDDSNSYLFVMPSMSKQLVKLRGYGLNFPDIRVKPIKQTLENHVFKEMGVRGLVLVKEEEKSLGVELYGDKEDN